MMTAVDGRKVLSWHVDCVDNILDPDCYPMQYSPFLWWNTIEGFGRGDDGCRVEMSPAMYDRVSRLYSCDQSSSTGCSANDRSPFLVHPLLLDRKLTGASQGCDLAGRESMERFLGTHLGRIIVSNE